MLYKAACPVLDELADGLGTGSSGVESHGSHIASVALHNSPDVCVEPGRHDVLVEIDCPDSGGVPVELESHCVLVDGRCALVELCSRNAPVELGSRNAPVELYSRSALVELYSRSAPVELYSQSVPVELCSHNAPVELYSQSVPVELYSRSAPVKPESLYSHVEFCVSGDCILEVPLVILLTDGGMDLLSFLDILMVELLCDYVVLETCS